MASQGILSPQMQPLEEPSSDGGVDKLRCSGPVLGKPVSISDGFQALSFKHAMFSGAMDPLVMVDHYTMTEPTFGAHPHAGMSAVTILFEDSKGIFNNRDSLGNDIDLAPGDLYWLKAASGAVHDEKPKPGSRAHGLQMFVNLPAEMKQDAAQSLHVSATAMPVIESDRARVRITLGESNGVEGAKSPARPMTILDAKMQTGGRFSHKVAAGHAAMILCISGKIEVRTGEELLEVSEGQALAIEARQQTYAVALHADIASHAALVTGEPIREDFVQRGPFVMSTKNELDTVEADYRAGLLGALKHGQASE